MNEPGLDFWGSPPHEPPPEASPRTAAITQAVQEALLSDEAARDGRRGYVAFVQFKEEGPQLLSLDSMFDLAVIVRHIEEALDASGLGQL